MPIVPSVAPGQAHPAYQPTPSHHFQALQRPGQQSWVQGPAVFGAPPFVGHSIPSQRPAAVTQAAVQANSAFIRELETAKRRFGSKLVLTRIHDLHGNTVAIRMQGARPALSAIHEKPRQLLVAGSGRPSRYQPMIETDLQLQATPGSQYRGNAVTVAERMRKQPPAPLAPAGFRQIPNLQVGSGISIAAAAEFLTKGRWADQGKLPDVIVALPAADVNLSTLLRNGDLRHYSQMVYMDQSR
ncbi:hypothetical protein [Xylophilus sp. GOD-11R]|uniref:hypothetical protein n=1 Tax=Xylophilus sp. GOD-11R TaxID=3089814 RepID=UPI00298BDE94|nr:hypothetical protein [Xylophilus sp. GOD-11R]WPB56345.1 hypothetical protein R9X41_19720 [Xylophilus sp. GOD-11R]